MARYSKIVKNKNKKSMPFLPEVAQVFIARRIVDVLAGLLLLTGLCFLAALFSYQHSDPSLNTAALEARSVANWLGLPGSYVADLFVQTLGMGGTIFAGILAVWGFRIFKRQSIRPLALRIPAAFVTVLLLSAALARFSSGEWMIHPYLGGSGGTLMLDKIASFTQLIASGHEHTVAAVLVTAVGLPVLYYALAITKVEARWFLGFVRDIALSIVYFVADSAVSFYGWVKHYNNADYVAPARKERVKPLAKIKAEIKAKKEKAAPIVAAKDTSSVRPSAMEIAASMPDVPSDFPASTGAAVRVVSPQKTEPAKVRQTSFALENSEWEQPGVDLLQEVPEDAAAFIPNEEALQKNAQLLQSILNDFNVEGEIVSIHPGPVVTLYELEPAPGVKSSRVIGLSDDIARSMSAVSVRCAVIPGRNVIGIEMPNAYRQTVYMRDVVETREVQNSKALLPLILGKDIGGKPIIADLAKMPHLLVAGTTGSGKSVAVNTMLLSLLYRLPPEKCRLILIDPKMLELSVYDDIPHLLSPVVTEPGKAVVALKWAVQEMEERYRVMSKFGVRNIEGYNERIRQALKKGETMMRKVQTGFDPDTGKPVFEEQPLDMTELPYIVIVVDEFADLMLVAGKDVENAVQRLAQMARAAGIHLIMATQRPSVDVITGIIKANFPTRISFQVTSKVDSRTILNEGGAEQLLGMGDMLYMASGGKLTRVHGPFVSDEDVEQVVSFLKAQGEPAYLTEVTEGGSEGGDSDVMSALFGGGEGGSDVDELYDKAVALVASEQKASTSFVQRHLQIGYNRAARIIEEMEKQGVIGPANHVGKREVLVSDFSDA